MTFVTPMLVCIYVGCYDDARTNISSQNNLCATVLSGQTK